MASDWCPRPNIVSQLPHEAGLSRRGHGCSWYRCIGRAIAWWRRRWRRCVEICGVVPWRRVLPLWRNLATRNHGCILAHGLGFNGCFELCVACGAVPGRGVTRGCEIRIRHCVCSMDWCLFTGYYHLHCHQELRPTLLLCERMTWQLSHSM